MTNATSPVRTIDGIPRDLPAAMRAELPDVADEIIAEIRRTSAEYASLMDGPYGQVLRDGIVQCIATFVDLVDDPAAPRDGRDEICRLFGQNEALSGRSMDDLHAVYRLGCQVAWRRITKLGQCNDLDSSVVSWLADELFTYMDELAALSVEAYQAAQARSGDARAQWRRRLLRLIFQQPPAPQREVADTAGLAGWPLPETMTPVALRGCDERALAEHAGQLDDDVLADLGCAEPFLLVPGEVTQTRERALLGAMPCQAVIGLTVPLTEVADSLRWARRALSLADAGLIAGKETVRCEDHLVTLWLQSDPALAEQIVRRQLGVLERLTERQRSRYAETLGAWLETRCTASEIAQTLHLHPQTIRYRIRQFEQAFGDRLKDPDARFGLELALRFTRLGQRVPRQGERRKARDLSSSDKRRDRNLSIIDNHDPDRAVMDLSLANDHSGALWYWPVTLW